MDWDSIKAFAAWVFTESHMGRIGRLDYFKQRVMLVLAALVLTGVGYLLAVAGSTLVLGLFGLLVIPVWFMMFYRSVTLDIQRLHDHNLSGWWVLLIIGLSFIPVINIMVALTAFIVFFLVPGTQGPNRFDAEGSVRAEPRALPPVSKSFAAMVQDGPVGRVEKKVAIKTAKPVAKKVAKPVKAAKKPAPKKRGGRR